MKRHEETSHMYAHTHTCMHINIHFALCVQIIESVFLFCLKNMDIIHHQGLKSVLELALVIASLSGTCLHESRFSR